MAPCFGELRTGRIEAARPPKFHDRQGTKNGLIPYFQAQAQQGPQRRQVMMKRTLYTALAAAAISTPALIAPAMFSPAAAQASMSVGLTIGTPPPAPVYEVVPAPRVGYAWAPGYWHWEGSRHSWHAGYWMPERRGYHWVPDR